MYGRLLTPKRCLILLGAVIFLILYFLLKTSKSDTTSPPIPFIEHYQNDGLLTPKNYHEKHLYDWVPAPTVPENRGMPGEWGNPVVLPNSMEAESSQRFKEHEFNIVASDMISANRSLKDVRDPKCLNIKYASRLPTTSIIIIFHNEAWSTLIRSLWSIINRSPKRLVKEIILVDDKSTFDFLGKQLDDYVETLPIDVKIIRMEKRLGLINARLRGAEISRGEVITFLDAHIECVEGWLEPLLSAITENRRAVAIPIIDIIKDNTLEYVLANEDLWGGFDWKLGYKWVKIPERERHRIRNSAVTPLHTPTMAGGLFSIDKEFFYEIGSYDEGMIIWGSENIEMSFRVWMCGGILEILPCSRVGHIFRSKTPYTFPGGPIYIVAYNSNRLANVWLDELIPSYYIINPSRRKIDDGNVQSRIDLRKKLNCKNFEWYRKNIYLEMDFPTDNIVRIQSVHAVACVVASQENEGATLYSCLDDVDNQVFVLTNIGEIRHHDNCLDADSNNGSVKLMKCHQMGGNQKWEYDEKNKTFRHNTGSCLRRNTPVEPHVNVKPCDGSVLQQWSLLSNDYEVKLEL